MEGLDLHNMSKISLADCASTEEEDETRNRQCALAITELSSFGWTVDKTDEIVVPGERQQFFRHRAVC